MEWLCKIFKHSWQDTLWNGYMTAVEQECRWCHKKRYHLFKDLPKWFGDEPHWNEGAHPNRPNPPEDK